MEYISTRGNDKRTPSMAILKGLAADGGLFMPEYIPKMDIPLSGLAEMDYRELAYNILKLYLTDFTEEELRECVNKAYDSKFDDKAIVPLKKKGDAYYLELFHGPTIAFKDMALSILPWLLTTAAKKNGVKERIVILTATSGDTGKAALEGFKDVPGTSIVVFYPKDGVSPVQEKQMLTTGGENTFVVGIYGNFDEAQSGVKEIFNDKAFEKTLKDRGILLSSANSINIGRLTPQIVYYYYAYLDLLKKGIIKEGDRINIAVPTGNFGNILAAYFAKEMGLPVNKLICASNENKVLYDFFSTDIYDRNRDFFVTTSPSMDILISSNLERLIYLITGRDAEKTSDLMKSLADIGRYEILPKEAEGLESFYGGFASEKETEEEIRKVFDDSGYVIDTHTAVASFVYRKYKEETGDDRPTVIASTASPFKFQQSVIKALSPEDAGDDEEILTDRLSEIAKVDIPYAVLSLRNAPIRHDIKCSPEEMKETLIRILEK